MKVGISVWDGRVSPVFDVARRLLVVQLGGGEGQSREDTEISEMFPAARVRRICELGVDVLICGAISGPLEGMLAASGVQVIPQICGAVDEVLAAFRSGKLTQATFLMPGCRGRHWRFRRRRHLGGPWANR